jgi:hypothetical protein
MGKDKEIISQLAIEYSQKVNTPQQMSARDQWRRLHNRESVPPLIYLRGGVCWEEVPAITTLECEDPLFRRCEKQLRQLIFQQTLEDDFIFEPWLTIEAVKKLVKGNNWGVSVQIDQSTRGQGKNYYGHAPIKSIKDLEKLAEPSHIIDENETRERTERILTMLDGNLDLYVSRAPHWRNFSGDISTDFAQLLGLEEMMMGIYTDPELLRELLSFMRDGILKAFGEAEAVGDLTTADSSNQAMPYAVTLPDPSPQKKGVKRKDLWCHVAAQEFAQVGPDHHEEFMFNYQIPIMEKFGLAAYGCCEDLTDKLDMLRRLPNIRRVALAPCANVQKTAESVGNEFVLSYRPNPTEMGAVGFDLNHIKNFLRRDMEILKANGCLYDVTLKDMQTVQNRPERLGLWVQAVRQVIEELY